MNYIEVWYNNYTIGGTYIINIFISYFKYLGIIFN